MKIYVLTLTLLGLAACDTAAPTGEPTFGALCETPRAPLLTIVPAGTTLVVGTSLGAEVVVGRGPADALAPDAWEDGDTITLPAADAPYDVALFGRVVDPRCADVATGTFAAVYRVAPALPAAPGDDDGAVALDDPRIVGWASGWSRYTFGDGVDRRWQVPPEAALGPAGEDALATAVLGNGGEVVLTFDRPLADGDGPDLAVFENAIDPGFLELARVAVSTDGVAFAEFDTLYLGTTPLGAFDTHDPGLIEGFASKYPVGWGTPFDLALLRYHPAVQVGAVDLADVRFVRVRDVIGDGSERDSFGHPVYDPTRTVLTGGFDLDAIAVLHEAP
ncbi:MAG: hypothetical protein EP329_12135 [Deltaproteobacteria bacterium]|nr:MAG: hypothetical protein EP329_12135 [Deltaproteobacteria bacterium]